MPDLEKYVWNPSVGNFCLTDGRNYLIPSQPLHIGQIEDHKVATEFIQKVYVYRYGYENTRLGVSRETDIQIATNLGII